jgi:hypothetical protein
LIQYNARQGFPEPTLLKKYQIFNGLKENRVDRGNIRTDNAFRYAASPERQDELRTRGSSCRGSSFLWFGPRRSRLGAGKMKSLWKPGITPTDERITVISKARRILGAALVLRGASEKELGFLGVREEV